MAAPSATLRPEEQPGDCALDVVFVSDEGADFFFQGGGADTGKQMSAQQAGLAVQHDRWGDDLDGLGGAGRIKRRGEDEVASVDQGILKHHDGRPIVDPEYGKVLHASECPQPVGPEAFAFDKVIPALDCFAVVLGEAFHALGLHGALHGGAGDLGGVEAVGGGFFEEGFV